MYVGLFPPFKVDNFIGLACRAGTRTGEKDSDFFFSVYFYQGTKDEIMSARLVLKLFPDGFYQNIYSGLVYSTYYSAPLCCLLCMFCTSVCV